MFRAILSHALSMLRPDWTQVARATLEVRQRYRYAYTAAVHDVRQRLVMVPPDAHGDQRLVSFELNVRGASSVLAWETDAFGNRVCRVTAPRVEQMIDFETHFRVRRAHGAQSHGFDPHLYLTPTPLTEPDAYLLGVADGLRHASTSTFERAEHAFAWADNALVYQVGVTGVGTSAAAARELGRGVCQDFTHLLLCVLRLLDIPARYVSGHLLGDGVPHAWVEALVDGQVIAYDPTHRRRARLDYVTVAVGRDYADVAPTSGVFRGSASGTLSASRAARVVDASHAPGRMPDSPDGEAVA
jgi:transglutaminase-like putative cysteine protease